MAHFPGFPGLLEGTASGVVSVSGTCVGSADVSGTVGISVGSAGVSVSASGAVSGVCGRLLPVLALLLLPEESRRNSLPQLLQMKLQDIISAAKQRRGTVSGSHGSSQRIQITVFFSLCPLSYGRICPFSVNIMYLSRCQAKSHRPSGVKLLGTDAISAHIQFTSVCKSEWKH